MKRSSFIHVAGVLITIIAFVAGWEWSQSAKVNDLEDAESAAAKAKYVDRDQTALGAGSESAPLSSGKPSSQSESGRLDAAAGEVGTGPLVEDQIDSLVWAAIKSLDPLDRRLAFDRLLQEMQSDSFTVEQAAQMRSLMHENGASGEQWRLFDYAWAAKFPEAAIAFIEEIPDQHLRGYLGNMLPGLASSEPKTAIDLFEGFDAGLQGQLRRRLFEGLIHHDRRLATNYIFDTANPEHHDWRPMDAFTRQLANEQGLQATLDWAAELPEGPLRANAWSAAFAKWTSQDSHSVSQALLEMPVSADRDQAINGFTSALSGEDPEGAVIWAGEIDSPGLREAAMVRAGTQYFKQDQAAAAVWFASSGLPAAALSKMNQASQ